MFVAFRPLSAAQATPVFGDLLVIRPNRRHRTILMLIIPSRPGQEANPAQKEISSGGNMRLYFRLLVPILLILPLNLTSVSAQENATISVVVTDATSRLS
jgi:hypothetical protein